MKITLEYGDDDLAEGRLASNVVDFWCDMKNFGGILREMVRESTQNVEASAILDVLWQRWNDAIGPYDLP